VVNGLEPFAQPLNHRATDENAALQRVHRLGSRVRLRDASDDQPVGTVGRHVTDVHEHEATRAIGVFDIAWLQTSLP
jgi:hypothetical protein